MIDGKKYAMLATDLLRVLGTCQGRENAKYRDEIKRELKLTDFELNCTLTYVRQKLKYPVCSRQKKIFVPNTHEDMCYFHKIAGNFKKAWTNNTDMFARGKEIMASKLILEGKTPTEIVKAEQKYGVLSSLPEEKHRKIRR